MTQKLWLRHYLDHDGPGWEVGCQCCGRIIGIMATWQQAINVASGHVERHRLDPH